MELNYKTCGAGEPVIILHGLFGMLDNWQTFSKKLGEHYQVFAIDQRDHGRSPHTTDFNYQLLSDDLHSFITLHNLEKVKLIGHSMGGRTIMQFAIDYPSHIDKMVVVDMGVKAYQGGHEDIIAALESVQLEGVERRSDVEDQLARSIFDQGVRLFLMKNLSRNADGFYQWKMNLGLLSSKYEEIMGWTLGHDESDVEVLFVRGTKSQYILEEDKGEILSNFSRAQFVDIEAGHWVHAEKGDELLKEILTYFSN